MKQRKWLLVALAILVLVLLWWAFGRQREPGSAADQPSPGEAVVTRGDLNAIVQATGRVEAERRARLSLPVGGPVAEIFVEVGGVVAEGDALLVLDTQELELRLVEARAALTAARASAEEAQAPAPVGEVAAAQARLQAARLALTVAEAELEDLPEEEQAESEEAVRVEEARAALEQARATLRRLVDGPTPEERAVLAAQVGQAEARVAQAEAALNSATLRAPFEGMIIERLIAVGERATPNQPLITLADSNTLLIVANVDEVDVGRVEAGQAVSVTLDAFPTRPLAGEVRQVAPAADASRGATTYRTLIDVAPPELPLRLDMAADLQIRTANVSGVLLLPLSAIRYAENQPYVLVRRDGEPVEQEVVLGPQDERMVAILEGVEEGEVVVLP
jgi:HlyD family secretion protein